MIPHLKNTSYTEYNLLNKSYADLNVTYTIINETDTIINETYPFLDDDTEQILNVTNKTHYHSKQHDVYQYAMPTIGAIVFAANVLVIISVLQILRKSPSDKATYIFMGNLALSDALSAVLLVGGALIPNHLRGVLTCYINLGLILSVTMASLYSVVLMSLDKYIYIVHCMRYPTIVTTRRAKLAACMLWVVSFIMGFVPFFLWKTDHTRTCMFVLIATRECVFFLVSVGIFIPLALVFISYAIILKHALAFLKRKKRRQAQNLAGTRYIKSKATEEKPTKSNVLGVSPETWRAFGACVIIVIAFLITWRPYFIASLMFYTCGDDKIWCRSIRTSLATVLALLGFCNSLLNPLIYTWWHKGFWKIMKAFIPCFSICGQYLRGKKKTLTQSAAGLSNQRKQSISTDITGISISTKPSTSDDATNIHLKDVTKL